MKGLPDFPAAFEQALEDVASRKHLELRRHEYWGVPIRTLQWKDGGFLRSVHFDYRDADIGVSLVREKTGGFFSFLRWCRNHIPMFPNLLQRQTSGRPALAKGNSADDYAHTFEDVIEYHV